VIVRLTVYTFEFLWAFVDILWKGQWTMEPGPQCTVDNCIFTL